MNNILQALQQYRNDLNWPVTDVGSIERRLAMIDAAIDEVQPVDEGSFCPACRDNEADQARCPFCNRDDPISVDIATRNAGVECLTVWNDGGWVRHGIRDAEIATLCEPDKVLLNIRLDTFAACEFTPPQKHIDLYERILGVPCPIPSDGDTL